MTRKTKAFRYTPEHKAFLKDGYASLSLPSLTEAFNAKFGMSMSEMQIRACLRNHRIRSGRTGFFTKGNRPWNTGVKGRTPPNSGQFKPGNMPKNKRRLWSERISKDGFVEISVPERNPHTDEPTRFKQKHVWLWEGHHGPVPKDHALIFKDGNRLNCEIGNLMLVTRAELLCLNLHNYRATNPELRPSVLALAKVEAKARIRTRPGRGRQKVHKEIA